MATFMPGQSVNFADNSEQILPDYDEIKNQKTETVLCVHSDQ